MDIGSISSLGSITGLFDQTAGTSAASATDGTSMFQSILGGLIDNVNTTDSSFNADIIKASEGELDNPHQLLIDSSKANIALQLASNVRNLALEAYNDISKMSL